MAFRDGITDFLQLILPHLLCTTYDDQFIAYDHFLNNLELVEPFPLIQRMLGVGSSSLPSNMTTLENREADLVGWTC
jgi:hypothetical protein